MKTQKQILLEKLQEGYHLSKMQIIRDLHILNVGDCVMKLREKGHPIKTEMVKNELTSKKFAIYYLEK